MPKRGPKMRLGPNFGFNGGGLSLGQGVGEPSPDPGAAVLAWDDETSTEQFIQWDDDSGVPQYLEWDV